MILTSASCLVTNPVDFSPEENIPPVILDGANRPIPISSVLEVDLDTGITTIVIDVRVRDENVFEELSARTRLITSVSGENPEFESSLILPTGEKVRDHTVRVEMGNIRKGECHRLEMVTSGDFLDPEDPLYFDTTQPLSNIGRAAWWIWEVSTFSPTDPTASQVLTDSCDTLTYLERQQ